MLLRYLLNEERKNDGGGFLVRFFLAGLVLGVGIAFKYTAAVYAIGLGVAFIIYSRSLVAFIKEGVVWGLGVVAGMLGTGGFWMYTLWVKFRNPFFPIFNHIFKSAYTDPTPNTDDRFLPKNLKEVLFYPYYFTSDHINTMEVPFQDLRFAFVHGLLLLVIVTFAIRWISSRRSPIDLSVAVQSKVWLCFFVLISYIVWQAKFSIYRYIAPLEQLSPIVIVILLGALISARRTLMMATVGVFSTIAVTVRPPQVIRMPWGDSFIRAAVPRLSNPAKSVIVITSGEPLGYLVPSFPASVQFIRIESNLFWPEQKNKLGDEIASGLAQADKDFYLLTSGDGVKSADKLLAFYNLQMVPDSIVPILTNGNDDVRFGRLQRRR
jgi:hypothetical protein